MNKSITNEDDNDKTSLPKELSERWFTKGELQQLETDVHQALRKVSFDNNDTTQNNSASECNLVRVKVSSTEEQLESETSLKQTRFKKLQVNNRKK